MSPLPGKGSYLKKLYSVAFLTRRGAPLHPSPHLPVPPYLQFDTLVGTLWRTGLGVLEGGLGADFVTSVLPTVSSTEPGTKQAAQ